MRACALLSMSRLFIYLGNYLKNWLENGVPFHRITDIVISSHFCGKAFDFPRLKMTFPSDITRAKVSLLIY